MLQKSISFTILCSVGIFNFAPLWLRNLEEMRVLAASHERRRKTYGPHQAAIPEAPD
jgi:hypothetical protein